MKHFIRKTFNVSASLFDSNVWLALTFHRHPFHESAKTALRECSPESPAALCRSTEQSFLRLASTSSVLTAYKTPDLNNRDVIGFLHELRKSDQINFLPEPEPTFERWLSLAASPFASPKLWMDAYLAAFAISGNLRFVTFDEAFRQFEPHGLQLHLLTN
jgi:uncharacterized protein